MSGLYPWQAQQWADLRRFTDSQRLGHALLFSGRDGLGVEALARRFARHTLCEATAARPCGECRGCTLFDAGAHPDFRTLAPAEDGKAIGVDQVRELGRFFTLKSHYERGKVVFIHPANAMNRAASNAILKLLEEPPNGALLLLVAHRFSDISMTIRSRCVRIPCEQIDTGAALEWLASELPDVDEASIIRLLSQSGGAPLLARAIAKNYGVELESNLIEAFERIRSGQSHALIEAKNLAELSVRDLQRALHSMILRIILAKFGCQSIYVKASERIDPHLQGLSDHLDLKHLYRFLDLIAESKGLGARQSGLRDADITESLWLGLADAAASTTGRER